MSLCFNVSSSLALICRENAADIQMSRFVIGNGDAGP